VHKKDGQWIKISTGEMVEQINQLANGLYELGCRPERSDEGKQKIALLANNRPEWNIVDNALMKLGLVNVPVYPTITDTEMAYIFNDASIEYAFVSDEELLSKVQNIAPQVPSLKGIYTFNEIEGATHWSTLLMPNKPHQKEIDTIANAIDEEELATIIYTSGTTGFPKGVMLTHKNVYFNLMMGKKSFPFQDAPDQKVLSFLPLNHIFEKVASYIYMYSGMSIYYAESLETIGENLKEVSPDCFSTVPRLLEKMFEKIMMMIYK
jgi:long-chain acyl-CoA synthetase